MHLLQKDNTGKKRQTYCMGQQTFNCLLKAPDHDPSSTPIPAKLCHLWHKLIQHNGHYFFFLDLLCCEILLVTFCVNEVPCTENSRFP
jgi:hypothetical protein